MSEFTTRFKNGIKRRKVAMARATTITERMESTIMDAANSIDSPIYRVRPYPSDGGLHQTTALLDHFHQRRMKWLGLRNTSPQHAFEMWHDDGWLKFAFVPGSPQAASEIRDQLYEDFPDSTIDQAVDPVPTGMFEPGRALAGARFNCFRSPHLPIKSIGGPNNAESRKRGFYTNGELRDPYKDIITAMTRDGDARVIYQTLFKPISLSTLQRWQTKRAAKELRDDNLVAFWTYDATDAQQHAADVIEEQLSEYLFRVEARVIVTAETQSAAVERIQSIGSKLKKYYETDMQQGLYAVPASSWRPIPGSNRRHLTKFATRVAGRQAEGRGNIDASTSELAGLAHLPEETVNFQAIDRATSKTGRAMPLGTPRFDWSNPDLDFSKHRYPNAFGAASGGDTAAALANPADAFDPDLATQHERQVLMESNAEKSDAFYLGFGARRGIEAGVFDRVFDTHGFIGGASGEGKTTLLNHIAYQVAKKGHGAFYYDQKGADADRFLSVLPEDRRDDVVMVEIGGNSEKQVGFNFLEVPTTADDPDSAAYKEAVGDLMGDVVALLTLAGGSEDQDYWGPRMDRIARPLIQGLGRIGEPCTLVSIYYALLTQQGREEAAERFAVEGVEFVEDFARDVLVEMEDDDLQAIISRLERWVMDPIVRDIVSHTESTVSIDDIVREGKIVIVQDKTNNESAGKMIATALIRRMWVAVREQSIDDTQPDPPMMYALMDEFQEIATKHTNIHQMFAQARAFPLSLIVSAQDLTDQLDNFRGAIEGQARTFLSFNPGRDGDAKAIQSQHSEDIGYKDLRGLDKYRFYLTTERDDESTAPSVKVASFPPLEEIADFARSDEEVNELIEHSLDRYGAERRSAAQIKDDTPFYNGPVDLDDDAPGEWSRELHEPLLCKAAYDAALRGGTDTNGTDYIPADALADRALRYLPDSLGFDHRTDINRALAHIPEDVLARRDLDAEQLDRAAEEGTIIEGGEITGVDSGTLDERAAPGVAIDTGPGAYVRCTENGRTGEFGFLDTGANVRAGGPGHDALVRDSYDPLTRAGFVVEVPIQGGADMDDAHATLADIDALDPGLTDEEFGQLSMRERQQVATASIEQFADEHPIVHRLADAAPLAIEAEKSTAKSNPSQTWINLAQAVADGRRVLFTSRERDIERAATTLYRNGPYAVSNSLSAESRCYTGHKLSIDGDLLLRPGPAQTGQQQTETAWIRDETSGEYVLRSCPQNGDPSRDADGVNEYAHFDTGHAVFAPRNKDEYPAHTGQQDEHGNPLTDDGEQWVAVRRPFIPEYELSSVGPHVTDANEQPVDPNEWNESVARAILDETDLVAVPSDAHTLGDLKYYPPARANDDDADGPLPPLDEALLDDLRDVDTSTPIATGSTGASSASAGPDADARDDADESALSRWARDQNDD